MDIPIRLRSPASTTIRSLSRSPSGIRKRVNASPLRNRLWN